MYRIYLPPWTLYTRVGWFSKINKKCKWRLVYYRQYTVHIKLFFILILDLMYRIKAVCRIKAVYGTVHCLIHTLYSNRLPLQHCTLFNTHFIFKLTASTALYPLFNTHFIFKSTASTALYTVLYTLYIQIDCLYGTVHCLIHTLYSNRLPLQHCTLFNTHFIF